MQEKGVRGVVLASLQDAWLLVVVSGGLRYAPTPG